MAPVPSSATQFASAYNLSDLPTLVALLSESATAEVLGAPFEEEIGREKIARTSLPYILQPGPHALTAEVHRLGEAEFVLLVRQESRLIEMCVQVQATAGKITRLEYWVVPFRRIAMVDLVKPLGLEVAPLEA
ncbi:MAG TPA: hypothetical protein VL860_07005 [Planctomycetota bacterium]|nr:hypothetical protein [Planctomycetota bacterium]